MIRKVKIDAGIQDFIVNIDENYFYDNTWKRETGNSTICPDEGTWKMGHKNGSNSHYLYILDKNGNNILLLSQLSENAGDRGLGIFLSYKHSIARDVILGWKIVSADSEWNDSF